MGLTHLDRSPLIYVRNAKPHVIIVCFILFFFTFPHLSAGISRPDYFPIRESISHRSRLILQEAIKSHDPHQQLMGLFGINLSQIFLDPIDYLPAIHSQHKASQSMALSLIHQRSEKGLHTILLEAMHSRYPAIRLKAASFLCLSDQLPSVEIAHHFIRSLPSHLQTLFIPEIASETGKHSLRMLQHFLNSSESLTRLSTIQAIGAAKREDLIPSLQKILTHSHDQERGWTAFALAQLQDASSLSYILSHMQSPFIEEEITMSLAAILLGETVKNTPLFRHAKEGNPFALFALRHHPEGISILKKSLEGPDENTRLNGLMALLFLQNDLALEDIWPLFESDHHFLTLNSLFGPLEAWSLVINSETPISNEENTISWSVKAELLTAIFENRTSLFNQLAKKILEGKVSPLVSHLLEILEKKGDSISTNMVIEASQGAKDPLVRSWCHLTLYRMTRDPIQTSSLFAHLHSTSCSCLVSTEYQSSDQSDLLRKIYSTFIEYPPQGWIDFLIKKIDESPLQEKPFFSALLLDGNT
ncbi:MAG: HEAT repeat domain-containing protein [Chlamydiota bacterium]|nr:HEAT repeat domain-containing protein [Chlamydiota bacterium]